MTAPVVAAIRAGFGRIVSARAYEEDPGFREVVLRVSRRGMWAIFLLGVGSIVFYTSAHYLFIGRTAVLYFKAGDPMNVLTLWDNLLVLLLSISSAILARSRLQGRWGRLLIGIIILVVTVALLADDAVRGTIINTPMYLILLMLIALGTMPYRPSQMLLLCTLITCIYFAFAVHYTEMMETTLMAGTARRMIPLIITTILCTGISALIYRSRYEQYMALRRAEELAAQVTNQSEKLIELEQAKSRFFANISHEFRTPLTLILGPIEIALRDGEVPDAGLFNRQLRIMQRNALRLRQLIDQLLDLSKLEAGRMELDARKHNLISFVRSIVHSFVPLADRRQITLQFHADREQVCFPFDAEKLEKVIDNLLSNAFKFTPPHGKVLVLVRNIANDSNTFVEISVRDTGVGIPNEKLPHVFDRFYQVESVASNMQVGTGIGLSIVKEIVELHGGTVQAESQPGFGSTFTIRFDLGSDATLEPGEEPPEPIVLRDAWHVVQHDDRPATAAAEAETVAHDHGPLVLVVDDNTDMRSLLRHILSEHYRVAEASDGREALDRARALHPDLVVSDVIMPEMDGLALCAAVKSDPDLEHIPVVLVTARAEEESKMEGLALGADDYLCKPFSPVELLTRAENLIELRRTLRDHFSQRVNVEASEITVQSAEAAFLERVRGVIEKHMGNGNFGVDWLAEEVNLSPRQLQRRLQTTIRLSAGGYVRLLRLQRAAQLLAQHAGSVAETAYAVGFQDPNYFSRLFKQTFGVSPSDYTSDETFGRDKPDTAASSMKMA